MLRPPIRTVGVSSLSLLPPNLWGAEESSVGIALLGDGKGDTVVAEVALQHSTLNEARIVATSVADWLENELRRMQ